MPSGGVRSVNGWLRRTLFPSAISLYWMAVFSVKFSAGGFDRWWQFSRISKSRDVFINGGNFIGGECRSVIIFRGGIMTGERMCFTFVRNTGEAASCLVEGGGQQKGMRS